MPRKNRIIVPGILHHIMARSLDGLELFRDDDDRRFFLNLLSVRVAEAGFRLYAWVLMRNHYHLLLRTSEKPLSAMMRRLNAGYAIHCGKKYKRRGYLFQGRFKSIATQDQKYIEELVRYIHLNPVRVKTCTTLSQLDHYPWCGHAVLMGLQKNAFQETGEVLRRFGKSTSAARRAYHDFMVAGIRNGESPDLLKTLRKSNSDSANMHSTDCWVIGDPGFVGTVLQSDKENRVRLAAYQKWGLCLDDVADKVAHLFNVTRKDILKRSRGGTASKARKAFAWGCRGIYGFPVVAIARYLGVSAPVASITANLGEKYAAKYRNILLNLRP